MPWLRPPSIGCAHLHHCGCFRTWCGSGAATADWLSLVPILPFLKIVASVWEAVQHFRVGSIGHLPCYSAFQPLFGSRQFHVLTDHKPLTFILSSVLQSFTPVGEALGVYCPVRNETEQIHQRDCQHHSQCPLLHHIFSHQQGHGSSADWLPEKWSGPIPHTFDCRP